MKISENLNAQRILDEVDRKSADMVDKEVRSWELNPTIEDDGQLSFNMVIPFPPPWQGGMIQERILPDHSAETQLLNMLRIPVDFHHRCSSALRQEHFTEFNTGKTFVLRCRNPKLETSFLTCRAVVSPSFSKMRDDRHVFPIVLNALEGANIDYAYFEYDDHITQLLIRYLDSRAVYNDVEVIGSVSIINSETGHSAVRIEPSISVGQYELRNQWGEKSEHSKRIIHRGYLPKAEEITQVIKELKNISQVGVIQYLRACQETIDKSEALEFVQNLDQFPKRFSLLLEDEWLDQEALNKANVMMRVLQLAKDLPLVQSLTVRQQIGRFAHLFEDCADEITQVAEMVNV